MDSIIMMLVSYVMHRVTTALVFAYVWLQAGSEYTILSTWGPRQGAPKVLCAYERDSGLSVARRFQLFLQWYWQPDLNGFSLSDAQSIFGDWELDLTLLTTDNTVHYRRIKGRSVWSGAQYTPLPFDELVLGEGHAATCPWLGLRRPHLSSKSEAPSP